MQNTKTRNIIIFSIIGVIVLGLLIVSLFSRRIASNPAGTVGNTAGNINNDGLFCEHDGLVYFSNSSDNGNLYSMNIDESNVTKLSDLKVVNLLAGGKYLYFFQLGESGAAGIGNVVSSRSFIRTNLNGEKATSMFRGTVIEAQLVDNYLYMTTSENSSIFFKKLKIDKTNSVDLTKYEINPACARDSYIYYNGTQGDHYLYALNTTDDTSTEILAKGVWYPCIEGDYIYYMDIENNYRLCRYLPATKTIEVLTEDRVDCFNVGHGYIYYQKNDKDNPALICMRYDGSDKKIVAEGNYTSINMTSQYVYFKPFGIESTTYHSFLGSGGASIFKQ